MIRGLTMERRENGRKWYWLSLVVVAFGAILIGYFFGLKRGHEEREALVKTEIPSEVQKTEGGQPPSPTGEKMTYAIKPAEPVTSPELPETCSQIDENIEDFFKYLDQKESIRKLNEGSDTFKIFQEIIRKLSSQPPIPAGEALDSLVLSKNIFYFYRVLDKNEIRLIKEILKNESGSLELNLDLFYKWITTGNGCPDKNRIKPSMNILYPYAGYLINSIGGRAYLFRRRPAFRLLVSYYCLLIIHKADKTGKNSYGIDIYPQVKTLREEMSYYNDFLFQKTYLDTMDDLSNYYAERR
jgi:hypothetical protein